MVPMLVGQVSKAEPRSGGKSRGRDMRTEVGHSVGVPERSEDLVAR